MNLNRPVELLVESKDEVMKIKVKGSLATKCDGIRLYLKDEYLDKLKVTKKPLLKILKCDLEKDLLVSILKVSLTKIQTPDVICSKIIDSDLICIFKEDDSEKSSEKSDEPNGLLLIKEHIKQIQKVAKAIIANAKTQIKFISITDDDLEIVKQAALKHFPTHKIITSKNGKDISINVYSDIDSAQMKLFKK